MSAPPIASPPVRRPGYRARVTAPRRHENIVDLKPTDRFFLSPAFVAAFTSASVAWGPVGYITYKRTYARPLPDGGVEEWWQTVARVVEGTYTIQKWHCNRLGLPWSDRRAQRSAQEMYRLIFEMKFLPPGRGLWGMGTATVERIGSACLMNCAFHSTGGRVFSRPYAFTMNMSMLGVGLGFDTAGAGKWTIHKPRVNGDVHRVEDSREGWVKIVSRVLDAYVGRATLPAAIDYSRIRPAGAPIAGFGGIAAGPEPLIHCIEGICRILDPLIRHRLTSTAIVDLMDTIGVCVVSGNVRRSALLGLGQPDDHDFLTLKDPDLHPDEMMSHRWASNNTVFATAGMNYRVPAAFTAKNGEPGYFWLENARHYGRMGDPAVPNIDGRVGGLNPCGEMNLESGELCCLVETFPSRHATYEEYEKTLKYAYLYAKTVTLIPTHDRETNRIQMRNRRIGLSQSGIVQSFGRHGRRSHFAWSDQGYRFIRVLDTKYSDWLAVPRSIKVTTVKPAGTTSLLPGVTPGMHYEHAEYYFRTIRISRLSVLVPALRRAGYRIEDDLYDPSGYVVYFPIKAVYFERSKDQVSMWEQLEVAAQLQAIWSDNAVSVTITFRPEEAADLPKALELYESRLKSVSFLPLTEHGYVQAPYITITREEYRAAVARLRPLDLAASDTHEIADAYCDGDACTTPTILESGLAGNFPEVAPIQLD